MDLVNGVNSDITHDNSKKIMKLIYKENDLHRLDLILNNRMEFLSFKRVSFLVLFWGRKI